MEKKIRVAVVGGNFGEAHILGFRQCPEIEVIAVCRRREELARQLAQQHQVPRYYTNFDEIVQSGDIDVVSLAVPHYLHHPMTMKALEHGKHVVCEKPLALNPEQAAEMADKAKEKGLVHVTVFNWRFVPAISRMKELIQGGAIGSVNCVFFNWLSGGRKDRESRFFWRYVRTEAGFGALGDTGVHGIDLIHWIFGDLKRVISHMAIRVPEHKTDQGQYKKTEVEDICSFLGELNNGAQVIFHASSVASCDSVIRLEAHGTEGVLGVSLFPNQGDYNGQLTGGKGEKSLNRVILIPESLKCAINSIDEKVAPRSMFFARLAQQLVKGIRDGQTPSPNFFDGLKAQKVLQALITSWQNGEWTSLV